MAEQKDETESKMAELKKLTESKIAEQKVAHMLPW